MQEHSLTYSLKIDFEQKAENPSRLFKSMYLLIDSFKKLDLLLAYTIDRKIEYKQFLQNIEVGSLTTNLYHLIRFPDDEKLGEKPQEESVREYINIGKKEILKTMDEHKVIDNINIIDEIGIKLNDLANNAGVSNTFSYTPADKLVVAQNIEQVAKSVKELEIGESANYNIDKNNNVGITKDCDVFLEQLENQLIDDSIVTEQTMILKIKKPDFLGDSRWDFKKDNQPFPAKILADDWLDEFRKHKILIGPGDSLQARVKQYAFYDKNGKYLSNHNEIIEVLKLIPNPNPNHFEEII